MLTVEMKKHFPNFCLDVSFSAESSEILGLLGASGCGKSMTLKCVAGIETPDKGRIVLDDRVLYDSEKHICLRPQERNVGYLFQQYALFPTMTVWENIAAGCRKRGQAKREAVKAMLAAMRLEGLAEKRPRQLSGGQQQRVALARALINEPKLLLLDEPFSALDSHLGWQMEGELRRILADFGGSILYVSHNRGEVGRLCSTVCVLDHGKSQEKSPVSQLLTAPKTYAGSLLAGCRNFSAITMVKGKPFAADWGIPLPEHFPENAAKAGILSHHVVLSQSPEGGIPCTLQLLEEGSFSLLFACTLQNGAVLQAEVLRADWTQISEGGALYAHLPQNHILPLTV